MEKIYFTPGPSQLYPTVPSHIQQALEENIPSISHRSEEFRSIHRNTAQLIKKVMGAPESTHVFFLGSATEAMERIVQNTAVQKTFHFVNGSFSKRFYKIASLLGKQPHQTISQSGKPFDFDAIRIPQDSELISMTQNETSMGVAISEDQITRVKQENPHAILAVDVVSSAPCVNLDWSAVDCAFFSVQKCFGLPAGLGVLMLNEATLQRAKSVQSKTSIGSYHNFQWLAEDEAKFQTPETPNVLGIYLLGKVCEDFSSYGVQSIKKDSLEKSKMLYEFFEKHPSYQPFVDDAESRSQTVIVSKAPHGSKEIISKLKAKGMMIGSGYAEYKESHIRIANFPAHSKNDLKHLIQEFSIQG